MLGEVATMEVTSSILGVSKAFQCGNKVDVKAAILKNMSDIVKIAPPAVSLKCAEPMKSKEVLQEAMVTPKRNLKRMHVDQFDDGPTHSGPKKTCTGSSILYGEKTPLPNKSLVDLFEDQVRADPEKTAVVFNGEKFTYQYINAAANSLATNLAQIQQIASAMLQSEGDSQPRVGVFIPPCEKRVVTLVALWKLGLCPVPLDVSQPANRMTTILAQAQACALLYVSQKFRSMIQDVDFPSECIFNYEDLCSISSSQDGSVELDYNTPRFQVENPMMTVLYTSGSTGTPKGVPLRQNNLLNRVAWYWKEFPMMADDIGCHKTSILFVDSLTEILCCLLKGVPLVILPREDVLNPQKLIDVLHREKVTRIVLVPSLLKAILGFLRLSDPMMKMSLNLIICSGEVLPVAVPREFFSVFPSGVILANFFGSTEVTGDVLFQTFRNIDDVDKFQHREALSIGIPIDNTNVYILDSEMKQVREDEIGNVFVSGANVVNGYLSSENSSSFLPNTIIESHNCVHKNLYTMGDLGLIKNGRIYYMGREDTMLKINGHRVNTKEIESNMSKNCKDLLTDVSVLSVTTTKQTLVAFCVCDSSHDDMIKQNCRQNLPSYMVPEVFCLDRFPLQSHTGKIDRQMLRQNYVAHVTKQPDNKVKATRSRGADPIQDTVIDIIQEELGLSDSDVTAEDNFFALGGNSISAMTAVLRLKEKGLNISMDAFLMSSSLKEIVNIINGANNNDKTASDEQPYGVTLLGELPNKEEAISLLAREFSSKNPLDVMRGISESYWYKLLNSIWTEICSDNLSVAAVEKSTGKIVGVSILFDMRTKTNPVLEFPERWNIIHDAAQPVADAIMKECDRWIDSALNAVDSTLPDKVMIQLLIQMEDEIIRVAERNNYAGILASNSHPVTIGVAEHHFGYRTENKLHVKSYVMDGSCPFHNAEDDYVIHAMLKRL